MIRSLIESYIRKHKNLLLQEARRLDGFMRLLMKQRNTGTKWTKTEKAQLRRYLRGLVFYIPVLCIILLPGGFFLIPLLAEAVDRRLRSRKPTADDSE
jgi:hypothetical protein